MADFGHLVLLIGDFHSPQRTGAVSACFEELLSTDKISMVICTGNVGSQANIDMLERIAVANGNGTAENLKIVCGDQDSMYNYPESSLTTVANFKLGVVHGHQIMPWGDQTSLTHYAGRLGADVLVCGHTHKTGITQVGDKYLVNPGSVTGACNAAGEFGMNPSFMLMSIQGKSATIYTYEEVNGEANVTDHVITI